MLPSPLRGMVWSVTLSGRVQSAAVSLLYLVYTAVVVGRRPPVGCNAASLAFVPKALGRPLEWPYATWRYGCSADSSLRRMGVWPVFAYDRAVATWGAVRTFDHAS